VGTMMGGAAAPSTHHGIRSVELP